MKINLRKRKLKDGRTSLFLEYYKGYTKDVKGKIKHNREFENLELYLTNKPKTPSAKQQNKTNLDLAEKIKTKRQAEYDSGKFGFRDNTKINTDFIEFFKRLTDERFNNKGNHGNWESTHRHLIKHFGEKLMFRDFSAEKLISFKNYLDLDATTPQGKNLAPNTKISYFNKVKSALNRAFKERIIFNNSERISL